MPQIVNLGNFGKPAESPMSGLADALAQGIKTGSSVAALKAQQAMAARKLAQADAALEKKQQDASEALAKKLSHKYYRSSPEAMKVFLTSEPGKALAKEIKAGAPWYFDEDGNFTPATVDELNLDMLKMTKESIVDWMQKNPGKELPASMARIAPVLFNVGAEQISQVTKALTEDPEYQQALQAGDSEKIKAVVEKYAGAFKSVSSFAPVGTSKIKAESLVPEGSTSPYSSLLGGEGSSNQIQQDVLNPSAWIQKQKKAGRI